MCNTALVVVGESVVLTPDFKTATDMYNTALVAGGLSCFGSRFQNCNNQTSQSGCFDFRLCKCNPTELSKNNHRGRWVYSIHSLIGFKSDFVFLWVKGIWSNKLFKLLVNGLPIISNKYLQSKLLYHRNIVSAQRMFVQPFDYPSDYPSQEHCVWSAMHYYSQKLSMLSSVLSLWIAD